VQNEKVRESEEERNYQHDTRYKSEPPWYTTVQPHRLPDTPLTKFAKQRTQKRLSDRLRWWRVRLVAAKGYNHSSEIVQRTGYESGIGEKRRCFLRVMCTTHNADHLHNKQLSNGRKKETLSTPLVASMPPILVGMDIGRTKLKDAATTRVAESLCGLRAAT